MVGVGSWFGSFGLHGVLFSTLLVVDLQESELRGLLEAREATLEKGEG